ACSGNLRIQVNEHENWVWKCSGNAPAHSHGTRVFKRQWRSDRTCAGEASDGAASKGCGATVDGICDVARDRSPRHRGEVRRSIEGCADRCTCESTDPERNRRCASRSEFVLARQPLFAGSWRCSTGRGGANTIKGTQRSTRQDNTERKRHADGANAARLCCGLRKCTSSSGEEWAKGAAAR